MQTVNAETVPPESAGRPGRGPGRGLPGSGAFQEFAELCVWRGAGVQPGEIPGVSSQPNCVWGGVGAGVGYGMGWVVLLGVAIAQLREAK